MLSGGEQRITLPAIIYLLLLWTPASFLFALIVIPEHRVNRAIKQILATPLLAVQFLLPFAIASESKGNIPFLIFIVVIPAHCLK